VGALLALLALIYFTVYQTYKVLAPRTSLILSRLLRWSVRHPVLGRFAGALIDPRRHESPSLLVMALLLIFGGWAFFSVLMMAAGHDDPSALDLLVHHLMFGLRTPLADLPMAVLAGLGDWQALLPCAGVVGLWLAWRKRWVALWHWVAAFAFALSAVWVLDRLIEVPRPPAALAAAGFDFPSAPVTLATVVYGFFAVLIARELPGLRPLLVSACAAFGCAVPLPREVEWLSLESSDLQSEPNRPGRYVLLTTLRNRAEHPLALPHLELTLTDAADRPVARRVMPPADWLPAHAADTALEARTSMAIRVDFEIRELMPTGYRIHVFYP